MIIVILTPLVLFDLKQEKRRGKANDISIKVAIEAKI